MRNRLHRRESTLTTSTTSLPRISNTIIRDIPRSSIFRSNFSSSINTLTSESDAFAPRNELPRTPERRNQIVNTYTSRNNLNFNR